MTIPKPLEITRPRPEVVLTVAYKGPGYLVNLQVGGYVAELTTEEARRLYTWLGLALGPAPRE